MYIKTVAFYEDFKQWF